MKFLFYIILLALLFSLSAFSQDRIHRGIITDKPTFESLSEIHKQNVDDLQGLNVIESLLMKSKNSDWQTVLKNPQRDFYEGEGFDVKNTRTIINKTLFDNGFLLIEEIHQTWDGSAWMNSIKWSNTYDGSNNKTEYIVETWNDFTWVNYEKGSYTYDGNNNQTEFLDEAWNDSAWVNYSKVSSLYDVNNNQTENLIEFWNGSAWVNWSKYLYTYDGNNNQTEELEQNWGGSDWVNWSKFSFTYDGDNNQTEVLFKRWDVSYWLNNSKYSSTYDGNNNLTEFLVELWNDSAWMNDIKYSSTYDGNNNLTERLYQTWDVSDWVNADKYSYTYVPVTAVNENLGAINSYGLSNNYPNPFNPSTNITYSVPERTNVSLKVFDLLGSEIVELVRREIEAGSYVIEFNAASLPSGVYFYRLQAGSFVEVKKMILIKKIHNYFLSSPCR